MNEPDPQNGGPEVPSDPSQDATSHAATEPKVESVQIADDPGGALPEGEGPYKNMSLPLVIIPAVIVITLLAIFALFVSISSSEATLEENLHEAVHGGKNERKQARFSLIRQLTANLEARARGEEPPNEVPADFGLAIEAAASELEDDGPEAKLALAIALANFDPERGATMLTELLKTLPEDDEAGRVRFFSLVNLGSLSIQGVESAHGAKDLALELLSDEDVGLRTVAASVLPHFVVDETTRTSLLGALDDQELQVRATAALALASLTPPAPEAIPLLTDMTGEAIWIEAFNASPGQFRSAPERLSYRIQAVDAIAKYGESTRELLEQIVEQAEDEGANGSGVVNAGRRALDQ